jgi:hypothetical protein
LDTRKSFGIVNVKIYQNYCLFVVLSEVVVPRIIRCVLSAGLGSSHYVKSVPEIYIIPKRRTSKELVSHQNFSVGGSEITLSQTIFAEYRVL